MDELLNIADQIGIYVIARPGPYINGETDAGGFPDWLRETPGVDRTNNPTYLSYSDQWQSAIDAIIARHQLTNGTGPVILYQIENEYANNLTSQTGIQYMAHLYAQARADGITVPIFHNDKGRNGDWVPGSFPENPNDGNYLYAFDGYPGGTCHADGSPGTPRPAGLGLLRHRRR
jgi:beta-galactosidase GanA